MSRSKNKKRPRPTKPAQKTEAEARAALGEAQVESIISAIKYLEIKEPFLLAAAIDWIRNEWRGEPTKLVVDGDKVTAFWWIKRRAQDIRAEAYVNLSQGVVRAAVAS